MTSAVQISPPRSAPGSIATLVRADGSAAARWSASLVAGVGGLRDLADAVHLLCSLYGPAPSLFEQARDGAHGANLEWLDDAAGIFAQERTSLISLTAAVGPMPSTPGHAESEAAIAAQRQAIALLGTSTRAGCSAGAAAAMLLDWQEVRAVLDHCAARLHLTLAPFTPDRSLLAAAVDVAPGKERAAAFGAQQLLAQHRGLWQLLEARASARTD